MNLNGCKSNAFTGLHIPKEREFDASTGEYCRLCGVPLILEKERPLLRLVK